MKNNNCQKGFATNSIIGVIAVLLIVSGIGYFASQKSSKDETQFQDGGKSPMVIDAMEKKEDDKMSVKPEAEMMQDEAEIMTKYKGPVLAGKEVPLLDFNIADYDTARRSDKLVVLYFYASWCPLCKEEVAVGLYPAFEALTGSRVVGFRVNYNDNDTDSDEKGLAREFGVGYQHTKVFVKNGIRVLKSPESWDKARYLSEINKAI